MSKLIRVSLSDGNHVQGRIARLASFAYKYAGMFPELGNPLWAKGRCRSTSEHFRDALVIARLCKPGEEGHVFDSDTVTLENSHAAPWYGPKNAGVHSVLVLGSLWFDFTARQFWRKAPFPAIWLAGHPFDCFCMPQRLNVEITSLKVHYEGREH